MASSDLDRRQRFAHLPLQYYWVALEPFDFEVKGGAGVGDVVDDLADVWHDLALGFLHWDAGETIEAIFNWSEDFRTHWSEHAVQALWALNAWYQQDSDRWNRPPA